jgi:hypothetical protein
MSRSRLVRRSVWVLLLCFGALLTALPQLQPSSPHTGAGIKTEEAKLYADAHPYLDEPLPKLKKMVKELDGLKPDSGPAQLSDLLARVGAKADELLQKVPNLISDEEVTEIQGAGPQGAIPGCVGRHCVSIGGSALPSEQRFNYIVLTNPTADRRLFLREYRTSRNGTAVPQGPDAPQFQGFVGAWIAFSSMNQSESRFRQLGQQKTDGHRTFVIGFAQIPGSIDYPGQIVTAEESIPMLLQGIAWVDQSDFRIVRLRTDILAPQPEIGFEKQTANILFGTVKIAELDLGLWLPQAVEVEMEARGRFFEEQHRYSKYRLYRAKSRIVSSPDP